MPAELAEWIRECSGPEWFWFVKVLAGNDTLANESHQAGPYIPLTTILQIFPSLASSREPNPRTALPVSIDSHGAEADVTVIWYNNKIFNRGTRNEARITGWRGKSSPLLDPEATGSTCVFAFHRGQRGDCDFCRVWLARDPAEEEIIRDQVGDDVEPGRSIFLRPDRAEHQYATDSGRDRPCRLPPDALPEEWKYAFPSAQQILERSIASVISARGQPPDVRLLLRRECEFELFRSIESALVLPRVREAFATVDLFVEFANVVTNRRKARSGSSLELQTRAVFDEEKVKYSHDEPSENGKRPDFLFPSAAAYRDPGFATDRLRMLGTKTTVKDRWRQILDEAKRIPRKHLLTLQQGVSLNQFAQMEAAGVTLVVPAPLHAAYHKNLRPRLLTVARFIEEMHALAST